jgi:Tfp pilus assembly protein PilN
VYLFAATMGQARLDAQPKDRPLEPTRPDRVDGHHRRVAMQVFLGMILGALLLVAGVYVYDSMSTSTVANGGVAQANRTIVNWDVAATDWTAVKQRAHSDWIRLSSK